MEIKLVVVLACLVAIGLAAQSEYNQQREQPQQDFVRQERNAEILSNDNLVSTQSSNSFTHNGGGNTRYINPGALVGANGNFQQIPLISHSPHFSSIEPSNQVSSITQPHLGSSDEHSQVDPNNGLVYKKIENRQFHKNSTNGSILNGSFNGQFHNFSNGESQLASNGQFNQDFSSRLSHQITSNMQTHQGSSNVQSHFGSNEGLPHMGSSNVPSRQGSNHELTYKGYFSPQSHQDSVHEVPHQGSSNVQAYKGYSQGPTHQGSSNLQLQSHQGTSHKETHQGPSSVQFHQGSIHNVTHQRPSNVPSHHGSDHVLNNQRSSDLRSHQKSGQGQTIQGPSNVQSRQDFGNDLTHHELSNAQFHHGSRHGLTQQGFSSLQSHRGSFDELTNNKSTHEHFHQGSSNGHPQQFISNEQFQQIPNGQIHWGFSEGKSNNDFLKGHSNQESSSRQSNEDPSNGPIHHIKTQNEQSQLIFSNGKSHQVPNGQFTNANTHQISNEHVHPVSPNGQSYQVLNRKLTQLNSNEQSSQNQQVSSNGQFPNFSSNVEPHQVLSNGKSRNNTSHLQSHQVSNGLPQKLSSNGQFPFATTNGQSQQLTLSSQSLQVPSDDLSIKQIPSNEKTFQDNVGGLIQHGFSNVQLHQDVSNGPQHQVASNIKSHIVSINNQTQSDISSNSHPIFSILGSQDHTSHEGQSNSQLLVSSQHELDPQYTIATQSEDPSPVAVTFNLDNPHVSSEPVHPSWSDGLIFDQPQPHLNSEYLSDISVLSSTLQPLSSNDPTQSEDQNSQISSSNLLYSQQTSETTSFNTFGLPNQNQNRFKDNDLIITCDEGKVLNIAGICVLPDIGRNIFVYEGPEPSMNPIILPNDLPKPKIEYNLVFVKAPKNSINKPIIIPPPQQKTLVYVLSKKENGGIIEIPAGPVQKPEVYYINYDEGDNPELPGGVSLQDALGGSISTGESINFSDIDTGITPLVFSDTSDGKSINVSPSSFSEQVHITEFDRFGYDNQYSHPVGNGIPLPLSTPSQPVRTF